MSTVEYWKFSTVNDANAFSDAPLRKLRTDNGDFTFSNPEDDLLDHAEQGSAIGKTEYNESDHDSVHTAHSDPLPDSPASSGLTLIPVKEIERHRLSSEPFRPLRGAFASSPPHYLTPDSEIETKQKARFDDDLITANLLLRRTTTEPPALRRSSAPPRTELVPTVRERDEFFSDASTWHRSDESENREGRDIAVALSGFEEIVEDLVQVVEEHEEAHEQLKEAVGEVVDAIFESREDDYDGGDEDENRRTQHSNSDRGEGDDGEMSDSLRRSALVEDIDESCVETVQIGDEDENNDDEVVDKRLAGTSAMQHNQPEVLFLTEERELKEPDLASIAEEPNSDTETVKAPSVVQMNMSSARRASEPPVQLITADGESGLRRRVSMTDFTKLRGRPNLMPSSSKALPAGCAITVCSVCAADPPRSQTVYEHPGALYRSQDFDKKPTKMAQTVQSDSGIFQMLWEEPPPSSSSSIVSLLDSSAPGPELVMIEGAESVSRAPSPMSKVKTKLAAWSWAREQGLENEDGKPRWVPLLSLEDGHSRHRSREDSNKGEEPLGPPNTAKTSNASSAKRSEPQTPVSEVGAADAEDDDEDQPLELKVRATLCRPPTRHTHFPDIDYLDIPIQQSHSTPSSPGGMRHTKSISRQPSNLAAEDAHFKTHRDFLELIRRRENEIKMNQELMNSRDSTILTRAKFDARYPKTALDRPAGTRTRDLSPISDASPPDAHAQAGLRAMVRVVDGRLPKQKAGHEAHSDKHVGCPIYEVERPRWFEENCKRGGFTWPFRFKV